MTGLKYQLRIRLGMLWLCAVGTMLSAGEPGFAESGPALSLGLEQNHCFDSESFGHWNHHTGLAGFLDTIFLETVPHDSHDATLGSFEPLADGSHGRSWTAVTYSYRGFRLTDPIAQGQPLMRGGRYDGRYTNKLCVNAWTGNSTHIQIDPYANDGSTTSRRGLLTLLGGGAIQAGPLIPAGIFDREPALSYGATPIRRGVDDDRALYTELRLIEGGADWTDLFFEYRAQSRTFPTLDENATLLNDDSERFTVGIDGKFDRARYSLGFEREGRSHWGAGYRFNRSQTLTYDSTAGWFAIGFGQHLNRSSSMRARNFGSTLDGAQPLQLNIAYSRRAWEHADSGVESVISEDLSETWTRMRRTVRPLTQTAMKVSMLGTQSIGMLDISIAPEWTYFAWDQNENFGTQRWVRDQNAGAYIEQDFSKDAYGNGWALPLVVKAQQEIGSLLFAFDVEAGWRGVSTHTTDHFIWTAQNLWVRWPLQKRRWGHLSFYVGRSPEFSLQAYAGFRHRGLGGGERYRWLDDGDGDVQPQEVGELLSVFGPQHHHITPGLRLPENRRAVIEWQWHARRSAHKPNASKKPAFGSTLRIGLSEHYHRWTVRSVQDEATMWREASFEGAETPLYERVAANTEGFRLLNRHGFDRFVGTEWQLWARLGQRWFWSLMGTGYWNIATTPFGLYADRNDPGILSEVSADPNLRISERGRSDVGRAYGLHLMSMIRLAEGHRLSGVLRYRDGQPMTRFDRVLGLDQGPFYVMGVARGDPIPRFTFHMTLDVNYEFSFKNVLGETNIEVSVYNLLNSGTEILENTYAGPMFRRSLEMVTGRTLYAAFTHQF